LRDEWQSHGSGLEVSELARIADVRPLEGHWVRLWFTDGVVKDVDLSEALAGGGVFDAIYQRRDIFEQVRVNPESRTIEWPGGVDLDPDVLYGKFEAEGGIRIERRVVKEPAVNRS
jgi:hypothetical protein